MIEFDIFTDGSSLIDGKYYEASSAYIVNYNKLKIFKGGCFHPDGTNSIGEVYAILMALTELYNRIISKSDKLRKEKFLINIYTDSCFVRDSLTKWIYGWAKAGKDSTWMNSQNKPVACQEYFKEIYYDFIKNKQYVIKFYHLRGHIGEKIEFEEAYKRFKKKNKIKISKEGFEYLVTHNKIVDNLADTIRINKIKYYYQGGNDDKCCGAVKEKSKNPNLIRIRSRKSLRKD